MMVGTGTSVLIIGHGIEVEKEAPLSNWATICPNFPKITPPNANMTYKDIYNDLRVMALEDLANFSIRIDEPLSQNELAINAWNAQWIFYLLALACRNPVFSIYNFDKTRSPAFMPEFNVPMIRKLPKIVSISQIELDWARAHFDQFYSMLKNDRFINAMIAYGNAHYLFDAAARVMLLWAGIEGLLGVTAELRHRIALHASILYDGTGKEKAEYFKKLKKSYDARSKVVHGVGMNRAHMEPVHDYAADILVGLLRKIIELGRVPEPNELDALAAGASLTR